MALGDVLVVTEADLNSGSLRSVEFALQMSKKIYVLPHRLNESIGTNSLIKNSKAEVIYDIEEFANNYGKLSKKEDSFLDYLSTKPTLDNAVLKFGDRVYEAELEGLIAIENGYIVTL